MSSGYNCITTAAVKAAFLYQLVISPLTQTIHRPTHDPHLLYESDGHNKQYTALQHPQSCPQLTETTLRLSTNYDMMPLHQNNIFITIHIVMCYKQLTRDITASHNNFRLVTTNNRLCNMLHSTGLYCNMLHSTTLYCNMLHSTTLYCNQLALGFPVTSQLRMF
jgi:hypothetical protein